MNLPPAEPLRMRVDVESTSSDVAPEPAVTSRELLGDRRELTILHDGRAYRLRITQNGKLILTA